MLKRLFSKTAWATLSLFLALTACTPEPKRPVDPPAQDSLPVAGDWIRIAHTADPDNLHPFNSRNAPASYIKENIHLSLATYNSQTLTSEPTLVTAPAKISPDGLSFSFEMRPEARWDDGSPITGRDFAFSLKCILHPLVDAAHIRVLYDYIEDVKLDPSNPRSFTVVTDKPFFQAELMMADFNVISRAFYDSSDALSKYTVSDFMTRAEEIAADPTMATFAERFNSESYARDPQFIYGSGPYKLESWAPGENVTLVRKKDWWGDQLRGRGEAFQGYAEKLIFKTIKDRSTLPAVARNGEIDVTMDFTVDDFAAAKDDLQGTIAKNYNFHTPATYNFVYLGFNCKPGTTRKPLLEDARVRQAIAHLVDVQGIIDNIYHGTGNHQLGPISPLKTNEYDASLKGYRLDVEQAKKLLDEAGWVDSDADGVRDKVLRGKKIKLDIEVLVSSANDIGVQILRMVADKALQAGVVITTNSIDFNAMSSRLRDHDFDMALNGFASNMQPTDLAQIWATESWTGGGSNFFGFGNATTDSLIAQIRQTPSAEARKPLYNRFQQLWLEQMPMVVLIAPQARILIHKRFHNALPSVIRPGYKAYTFWVPKKDQKFK